MDQKNLNSEVLEKVGKKFYGHNVLFSKYTPQIPAGAEREYIRLTNQYMEILKEELEKMLPELKAIYKLERDAEAKNRHNDSVLDLILAVSRLFSTVKNNIIVRAKAFGLERKLFTIANLNRRLTTREWEKAIRATLGIDIREDYYLGNFYADQLAIWVSDNVDLIKTIPEDTLDKMKDIVLDGFENGKTTTRIAREIQQAYGVSRRKAKNIARDQTAKLNGQIQRAQQQDAGISKYIWSTVGDSRVRDSHSALNGKVFSWDNAPVNSDGRKCHPGEDYNCRCIGRPVFDKRTLTLPVKDESVKVSIKKNGGM